MDSSIDKKLRGFHQIAQEKLQSILCSIPGSSKDIVIEPSLIKPLEIVCGATWLRNKGIDKIFKFDPRSPPLNRKQLVFLVSSDLATFKKVLDQISSLQAQSQASLDSGIKPFHVIVFPSAFHSFDLLLEAEGLYGLVDLYRFNWDFLTLDTGVLSSEIGPRLFRDVFLRRDTSLLGALSHSFRLFNLVLKKPHLTLAFGENAEIVLETVQKMEKPSFGDNPDFTVLLVMDREKDYVSCLLTSVVYSALLLELFSYKSGSLTVDSEKNKISQEKVKFGQTSKTSAEVLSLRMSDNDALFRENRYRHFTEVTALLNAQAKSLEVDGVALKDMKIHEMKHFVTNKLPQVAAQKKELFKHLVASEAIVHELGGSFSRQQSMEESMLLNENRRAVLSYIEEQLSIETHKFGVIRLMSLFYLTCDLTNDEATKFVSNYCNAFGHRCLSVFQSLANARLFPEIGVTSTSKVNILSNISLPMQRTQFQVDAQKLKLIPSASQARNASQSPSKGADKLCPSYVFNGTYIPLIAQFASVLLNAASFDEMASKLGHIDSQLKVSGRTLEGQKLVSLKEFAASVKRAEVAPPSFPLRPKTLFIYVVGGLTYAEIAACNLVERFTGSKIVLASDAIISGNDLIESAF